MLSLISCFNFSILVIVSFCPGIRHFLLVDYVDLESM